LCRRLPILFVDVFVFGLRPATRANIVGITTDLCRWNGRQVHCREYPGHYIRTLAYAAVKEQKVDFLAGVIRHSAPRDFVVFLICRNGVTFLELFPVGRVTLIVGLQGAVVYRIADRCAVDLEVVPAHEDDANLAVHVLSLLTEGDHRTILGR
jgi:hypothetical protein